MKFEKTWRKIIPQMIAAAIEDAEEHYRRTRFTLGTAEGYCKGVTNADFAKLVEMMLAHGVDYVGKYYPENKRVTYKVVILAYHGSTMQNEPFPYSWELVPVTEG